MIYFNNDYSEGCHPEILKVLTETNEVQTPGYGTDSYCASAAERIKHACQCDRASVHFLVGGTQANLTVIAAALRPYQGVLCADTGHINVHETGAIEATGHKVLGQLSADGKITASQVENEVLLHKSAADAEHMVQPKMVYISHPTEVGTLYTKGELTALSEVCKKYGLFLFLDGARLSYALSAEGSDLSLPDLAEMCDVFYIGGTKCGALFGEAVVITNELLDQDFRYMIKQRGGMLAKGRLLGIQFDTLFRDELYLKVGSQANQLANQIRKTIIELGYRELVPTSSNQVFPILPDDVLEELAKTFCFTEMHRVDSKHRCVRFCTSWATKAEHVNLLCDTLRAICK